MTADPSAHQPPDSGGMATTTDGLAPHDEKRGIVIDRYLQPELPDRDRFRIQFRRGAVSSTTTAHLRLDLGPEEMYP